MSELGNVNIYKDKIKMTAKSEYEAKKTTIISDTQPRKKTTGEYTLI